MPNCAAEHYGPGWSGASLVIVPDDVCVDAWQQETLVEQDLSVVSQTADGYHAAKTTLDPAPLRLDEAWQVVYDSEPIS